MPADPTADVVLRATGVTKHFAGVTALRGAGITLRASEVHALVGENGAGKSTLVKVLSGVVRPDAGRVEVDGAELAAGSASAAAAHGVAAVAQELSLFGDLTVAENLFPNRPPTVAGLTSARAVAAKAGPVLAQLGLDVPMHARVATLPLADRQLLEVCRAMVAGPRVLILDEPTSSLPRAAAVRLRGVIRALAGQGIAVLYISHFLEEVLELADRITVLRDGKVVRDGVPSASVRLADLVTAMLGDAPPERRHRTRRTGAMHAVAAFEHVDLPGRLVDVSFTASAGEVVGLAGLEDAGHLAALEVVTGRAGAFSGAVEVAGGPAPRSLRAAIRSGVAFVSSDRKRYGLMLDEPVWLNVGAVRWLGLGRGGGWLKVSELVAASVGYGRRLRIRGSAHQPAGSLSGGNQQKVVLAKWLESDPVLMVLDDPTRGVDVGARVEVHDVIAELADAGTSVLLASTDLTELVAVCDRVLVFQRGRIVRELAGDTLTEAELSVAMNAGFTAV
ncbi:sugar ABC transporter ATP-binding protein [Pseudonocardia acaciae]|uniref:sugar ABC transporter ATP-binding protein n=1 Tax=Pseudonocardia acaciae TaxID=551276 RepID=UPI000566FECE|nr:sugar ABC transporter ATP-binding protein [Pseudonocardia acaciae]